MSAHKPEMDKLTPAEMRVLAEYLIYTMEIGQRRKLRKTYPGLYEKICPAAKRFTSVLEAG